MKLVSLARNPLLWLALLYVLVGVSYALATPALEKHDEDGHYGYILYLYEHHQLPPLIHTIQGFTYEYKQPPLYYVMATVLTSWLPEDGNPDQMVVPNPYRPLSVPGHRNDNRNKFLHPPHMTPLVLGARLVSLSFGLGTMLCSFHLARLFLPDARVFPLAVAAVAGFQPHCMFMATAVNNDAAVTFFGTAVVTLLMAGMRNGSSRRLATLVGVALGFSMISKVSGLVFLPLAILTLILVHGGLCRAFFRDAVIVVAVALLVGGWWYVRNAVVYSDPFSLGTHFPSQVSTRPFTSRIWYDLFTLENTLWSNPAHTFVSRIWLDTLLVWWGRISLGLLVLGLLTRFRRTLAKRQMVVLLGWVLVFLILILFYWARAYPFAYGRLLLPVIAPIALLLVWGWFSTFPVSWRDTVLLASAGLLVTASALVPFVSISPIYHPWSTKAEQEIENLVGITYVETETGTSVAKLVGYNLGERLGTPGAYFPIELCWEPLAQTDALYTVFVHLLDVSQVSDTRFPDVWGSRRTYPGLGNLPTDRWMLGEVFCDTVLVPVSEDAPVPLKAVIEVGFVDEETDRRLQAVDVQGESPALAAIGSVPILSPAEFPEMEHPPRYILGDAIGLHSLQLSFAEPNSLILTTTWRLLQPVPYDVTMFVHLREEGGGPPIAQVDRQPLDGRFPTSSWLPSQVITDVVRLSLASGVPDNSMVVDLGMYTWPSMQRLSVVDAKGLAQPNAVITVRVPPSGTDARSAP